MLTSETAWLSDNYKPRIIQAEKQENEVKAVVKTERKISFSRQPPRSRPVSAAVRRASAASTKVAGNSRPQSANQTHNVTKSRVQSAPPRSRTAVPVSKISAQEPSNIKGPNQQGSTSNRASLEQNKTVTGQNNVTITETSTTQFLPTNSSRPDPNAITFYSQQIVTRTIEKAAFRQHNKSAQRSGSRPTSGRVTATRLLGKPRNAWGSSHELWYPADLSNSGRADALQKEPNPDFCLSPSPSPHDLEQAGSEDSRSFLGIYDTPNYRPHSSCSYKQQKSYSYSDNNRRVQSACSMRSKSPLYNPRTQQSQEEWISPWLDDPRVGLSIGFQQDPSLLYFDRHSRCHNHNHLHHPLLQWRPQPACTTGLENCGNFDVTNGSRPVSAMSMRSHPDRVQRYIDSHRPRTAPSTRKELQKHANPGEQHSSEYMPHYCNFVRSKAIHDRPKGGPGSTDDLDKDEDIDDGYITNTEPSPTNIIDVTSRRKAVKNKTTSKRTKSDKDETDGVPDPILRTVSPTGSPGYDPESLFERLIEQGLAGSNSALNDSTIEDDILGSPHVNFDLDDPIEKGSNHDATTQTSNIDTLLSRSSTPAREPIQIPSIDENSNDLTLNTSNDDKNKANAALVAKLISDQENKSAENQKSKRAPCVKKEKMPGKDKKKKGKKKVKTEEVVDAVPPPEITQVAEEANKGTPVDDNGVPQVDVNIPDLPSVAAPAKEGGKTSKRRTKKTIGAPSKKSEKTEPPKAEAKTEAGKFYDFGDLSSMATNSLEDRTLGKPTVKVPSYLNDRMVLSLQSSRFELPMDMKSLEKMSPQEYLKKHCVVSTRRRTLYQKIFTKYREKGGWMFGKHLMRCLKDVLVNTITSEQVEELSRLLDVENDSQIDFPFFCGIAALAERILYPQFLTEDTADCTEYQKEKVEVADFCSLEWKLTGVNVSSNIKQLLESIS